MRPRGPPLLVVALELLCVHPLWACPQLCQCLNLQVLCQEAGYKTLPPMEQIPRGVHALLLMSNQIESVASDAFRGLVRVRKLILDNNRISWLAPFAFRGLTNMDELSLQNNPLTVLSPQSFSGLARIRLLQLGFNQIGRVESMAFSGSNDIGTLSLEGNPLTELRPRAFGGLNRLGWLRLPREVTCPQPDAFSGLKNVSLLVLESIRCDRIPQFAFRGLEAAGKIHIRDANLGLVDSGAFAGLNHARSVIFEGCRIDVVRAAAFAGMRAVVELRLRNNRIGRLLPGALDALDEASVSYVVLQENWLPCDCTLRWAPDTFRQTAFCSAPARWLNSSAAQVPLSSLPRCAPQHWTPVQAANGAQRRPGPNSERSGASAAMSLPSLFVMALDVLLAVYCRCRIRHDGWNSPPAA
ncbi:unnamed protein product [Ixodes hexagonus]